jgi:hypothetical protein
MSTNINHPPHYTSRDIGFECIDIVQYQPFCTGNAIKYLWRYSYKGKPLEDLKKARWYAHRASMMQEKADTSIGWCDIILRRLEASVTGPEEAAWNGITQGDWPKAIEALNQMIKEQNR